jgi:hypothetical protein
MGILRVVLQDEEGGEIGEVEANTHLLDSLLPSHNDKRLQCLRFIDPYGDTIFNGLQMEQFLLEWRELAKNAKSPEDAAVLTQVEHLARRCRETPHLYLKFYGD